jgi:AcrR family transcriptional regulator
VPSPREHALVKRGLRADAERNRRQILLVAQSVFAAEGVAVPIDEIARRAGLGVGTLYRHFPTKEALFSAIVVNRMNEVTEDARALLATDTTGDEFFGFLTRMMADPGRKKDFVEALTSAGADMKDIIRAKVELHRHLDELLSRAQTEGLVREEVSMKEIFALLAGALGSVDRQGLSAASRERILAIVFDGLRPPAPSRKGVRRSPTSAVR